MTSSSAVVERLWCRVADSFQTQKLCSRLSSSEVRF